MVTRWKEKTKKLFEKDTRRAFAIKGKNDIKTLNVKMDAKTEGKWQKIQFLTA